MALYGFKGCRQAIVLNLVIARKNDNFTFILQAYLGGTNNMPRGV